MKLTISGKFAIKGNYYGNIAWVQVNINDSIVLSIWYQNYQ